MNCLGAMLIAHIHKKLNPRMDRGLKHDVVPELRTSGMIGPDAPNQLDEYVGPRPH